MLVARLGLKPGDIFRLGTQAFRLAAALTHEPDSATAGLSLGPRTIVATAALDHSGLLAPGSLYETKYRLLLAPGTDLAALQGAGAGAVPRYRACAGRDRRRAAPGVETFVRRIGSFLVLVGLAGLAVGGVGDLGGGAGLCRGQDGDHRDAEDAGGRGADDLREPT